VTELEGSGDGERREGGKAEWGGSLHDRRGRLGFIDVG
jgi:hypothetical protein